MAEDNGSTAAVGNPDGGTAAPAGSGAGAAPAAPASWYGELSDPVVKGWVENKQFKDPATMVQSYYNLEKLLGHEKAGRTIVAPGENATPEEVAAVFGKLGRPEKPDLYEMPTGEGVNQEFSEWAKKTFFEANLTGSQAKTMLEKWMALETGIVQKNTAAAQQAAQQATQALRQEWGMAFDEKVRRVDATASQLGLSQEHLLGLKQALGPAGAMKLLDQLGSKVGEHEFVGGGQGTTGFGTMTPDRALAEIAMLRKDPTFTTKYLNKDSEAVQRMQRLHQMAYPEG